MLFKHFDFYAVDKFYCTMLLQTGQECTLYMHEATCAKCKASNLFAKSSM